MSDTNPNLDTQGKTPETRMPTELERAKTALSKKIANEILPGMRDSNKPESQNEPMANFIANSVVARLAERFPDLPEDEMIQLFEGMPTLNATNTSIDNITLDTANIGVDKNNKIDDALLVPILEELTRAQLLARSSSVDYVGSVSTNGSNRNVHTHTLLNTFGSMYKKPNAATHPTVGSRMLTTKINRDSNTPDPEIYNKDPELFADMMIAFAFREGANSNGKTFNDAWKRMPGKGFDNYGTPVQFTEDGIPYRPGKRTEDVEMLKKKVAEFSGNGQALKTYDQLATDVAQLSYDKELLARQNEEHAGVRAKLTRELENVQTGYDTMDLRESMKANDLATEKKAREAAEERNAALEARIQELLAIAEESSKMFGDTRLDRIKQTAVSPLPEKPTK